MSDRKFYRITHGPCHEILQSWREQVREVGNQHWEFSQAMGAIGFIPGSEDNVVNGVAIRRLIFDGALPKGWKERMTRGTVLQRGHLAALPDLRTIAGKEAAKAMNALPLRPSTRAACDAIGFPHGLQYAGNGAIRGSTSLGFWETLSVGYIDDTFYVALPDERAKRRKLEEEGYTVEGHPWTPLPGMIEILREEMELDFARHNAATAALVARAGKEGGGL